MGDYTIPMANKLAALGPPVPGEIYAYGFRNAHRLSWDTDGTMFANDIGMNHIEEINIVRNGENYGWMSREGYFANGRFRGGAMNELYPLPDEILDGRVKDGFTYPVAIYDHDEGRAITAGFAYHGRIAALRGKYVFGDIHGGRIFVADLAAMKKADDGIPRTVAPIEESAALRAGRRRQPGECFAAGAHRSENGLQDRPRRSLHQPDPRRRAAHHIETGWHHSNARS